MTWGSSLSWDHGILATLIFYISLVQICGPSKTGIKPLETMGTIKTIQIFKATRAPSKTPIKNFTSLCFHLVSCLSSTDCKMKVNIPRYWPCVNSFGPCGSPLSSPPGGIRSNKGPPGPRATTFAVVWKDTSRGQRASRTKPTPVKGCWMGCGGSVNIALNTNHTLFYWNIISLLLKYFKNLKCWH